MEFTQEHEGIRRNEPSRGVNDHGIDIDFRYLFVIEAYLSQRHQGSPKTVQIRGLLPSKGFEDGFAAQILGHLPGLLKIDGGNPEYGIFQQLR